MCISTANLKRARQVPSNCFFFCYDCIKKRKNKRKKKDLTITNQDEFWKPPCYPGQPLSVWGYVTRLGGSGIKSRKTQTDPQITQRHAGTRSEPLDLAGSPTLQGLGSGPRPSSQPQGTLMVCVCVCVSQIVGFDICLKV